MKRETLFYAIAILLFIASVIAVILGEVNNYNFLGGVESQSEGFYYFVLPVILSSISFIILGLTTFKQDLDKLPRAKRLGYMFVIIFFGQLVGPFILFMTTIFVGDSLNIS